MPDSAGKLNPSTRKHNHEVCWKLANSVLGLGRRPFVDFEYADAVKLRQFNNDGNGNEYCIDYEMINLPIRFVAN